MSDGDVVRSAIVAAAVTVVVMPLVRMLLHRLTRADVPNDRSSHVHPTTRGGGLGCLVGIAAGVVSTGGPGRAIALACVTVVLFAALGLADDIRPLPAKVRLAGQLLCGATSIAWAADVAPDGALVTALFCAAVVVVLVGYTNAFNFMDGINGISGMHAAVCASFAAWAAWRVDAIALAATAAAVAAGALAFLPFNLRRRPMLFLGDVGSYAFGAAVMTLAVLAWRAGATIEAAGAAMVVYVADTTATMLRRLRAGKDIFEAHREHVYQQLTPRGAPHGPIASFVAVASGVAGLLGALTLDQPIGVRLGLDAGIAAVVVAYLTSPVWFPKVAQRGVVLGADTR